MNPSRLPARLARIIRARAGDACEYCRLPQQWQEAEFHFEHVLPRIAKGETTASNLALACVGCSLKKGARTKAVDPLTLQVVPLFNLRQESFDDHFQWTRTWKLLGRTPQGRATIAALELNRIRLLAVRRDLVAAQGRFPPE